MTNVLYLMLAFILVLFNALFVAAEFGMVKLRHTRVAAIKRTYGLRGRILAHIHSHLDAYLSACQLGITLASLGLGWIGEPAFAHLIEPLFQLAGIDSHELIVFISFLVAFFIISFLHIVIGELVPKSLAIRQSEKVSVWTAAPLFVFYWLMFPVILTLNFCANSLLKIAKLDEFHKNEHAYTPEEIKIILRTTHSHDQLSRQELDMLKHSIELIDLEAVDVMRPINEMITLKAGVTIKTALNHIIEHRYSRYPVYNEDTKEFIGIIHVKDILYNVHQQRDNIELISIMRPILKVDHHLPVTNLLNKLQEGMPHFALVYSGQKDPIGFVTIDNIFQVLVGLVRDEFHKTDESWKIAPDGAYLISGNSATYVLERALHIDITLDDESGEAPDTIFGMILSVLGRFPNENEKIEFDNFTMVIKKMKGHMVTEVAVYPKKQPDA